MMKTTEETNQPCTFAFNPAFAHSNAIHAGRKWVNGVRHTHTHTPDGGNLVPRFLGVFGQRVVAPLAENSDSSGYEI